MNFWHLLLDFWLNKILKRQSIDYLCIVSIQSLYSIWEKLLSIFPYDPLLKLYPAVMDPFWISDKQNKHTFCKWPIQGIFQSCLLSNSFEILDKSKFKTFSPCDPMFNLSSGGGHLGFPEGHMGKWKVIFLRYYKETESKQCINNQWIVVSIFCLVRNPS
jgi:hypothetical protein